MLAMKLKYNITWSLIFASFILPACAEIQGQQDLTITHYGVSGNEDNSFYENGDWDYVWEGNFDFSYPLGEKEFFGSISYRATDDKNTDPQDISLEKLTLGLKSDVMEFTIGDFYHTFTDLSLGNALKGLRLELGGEGSTHLVVLAGIDTAKWEDFWERRCDDSTTRRYVWGIRLKRGFWNKRLTLGLNYGGARDDTAYVASGTSPIQMHVVSVDGNFSLTDYLTISGEYAYSFTDEDVTDSSVKTKGDSGIKLAVALNTTRYVLNTEYSRMAPHFNTTGGFAAQNLESFGIDGVLYLPGSINFNHYLRWDRDNLDKSTTTTKQINPGCKFSFQLPLQTSAEVGMDIRKRFSVDKTTNETTSSYFLNLGRDFKIFYATLGYTRTSVDDKVDASQERTMDDVSLALDGSFDIKNVRFSWNIAEDLHHEDYEEVKEADLTLNHSIGLRLEFPSSLVIDGKLTINDNDYYINTSDSYIINYSLSISRNIKDNLSFLISYERKEYDYADVTQNYAETIATAKLSYVF